MQYWHHYSSPAIYFCKPIKNLSVILSFCLSGSSSCNPHPSHLCLTLFIHTPKPPALSFSLSSLSPVSRVQSRFTRVYFPKGFLIKQYISNPIQFFQMISPFWALSLLNLHKFSKIFRLNWLGSAFKSELIFWFAILHSFWSIEFYTRAEIANSWLSVNLM